MHVQVKRIYEPPDRADGRRILVDRVWPRGISKQKAALSDWCKDIAPSTDLRKWYGHDPAKFGEFVKRYRAELADRPEAAAALADLRDQGGPVTLLTATHDVELSQARVLADLLNSR